jgi:hypothetical protein
MKNGKIVSKMPKNDEKIQKKQRLCKRMYKKMQNY